MSSELPGFPENLGNLSDTLDFWVFSECFPRFLGVP